MNTLLKEITPVLAGIITIKCALLPIEICVFLFRLVDCFFNSSCNIWKNSYNDVITIIVVNIMVILGIGFIIIFFVCILLYIVGIQYIYDNSNYIITRRLNKSNKLD